MNYKTMAGSSQKKFACLNKIVIFMKERHLQGVEHPLSIDEIMDETSQLDVGSSTKNVRLNARIEMIINFMQDFLTF